MNIMKNLEMKATKLMSKAISSDYASKKASDPRMAKIFGIIMRKCVMSEGKIYRQKNGIAYGEPVGWYDAARMTGWMDKKAWKQILNDEDKPTPSYDDEDYCEDTMDYPEVEDEMRAESDYE